MVYAARIGARDLVARQRGYVARPRVMHNCFAKGAVSGLRNHVAHRSGMMVSFGVAEDTAAQRKVDFRFGSKADIAACVLDVRFTPESGHDRQLLYVSWAEYLRVLPTEIQQLSCRPDS